MSAYRSKMLQIFRYFIYIAKNHRAHREHRWGVYLILRGRCDWLCRMHGPSNLCALCVLCGLLCIQKPQRINGLSLIEKTTELTEKTEGVVNMTRQAINFTYPSLYNLWALCGLFSFRNHGVVGTECLKPLPCFSGRLPGWLALQSCRVRRL